MHITERWALKEWLYSIKRRLKHENKSEEERQSIRKNVRNYFHNKWFVLFSMKDEKVIEQTMHMTLNTYDESIKNVVMGRFDYIDSTYSKKEIVRYAEFFYYMDSGLLYMSDLPDFMHRYNNAVEKTAWGYIFNIESLNDLFSPNKKEYNKGHVFHGSLNSEFSCSLALLYPNGTIDKYEYTEYDLEENDLPFTIQSFSRRQKIIIQKD
ncbi:hypothetical protein [Niabella hibiscisoli]|uniref:hypothetical protein n=1 Tax=Niabella hibiscisoli TaxID=1825928 RepID=UPI001F0E6FDF|nr:hypothetical protein [Niabella hibiscisoli]MCH5716703.1 hypothetical protein [Niabella hibiscisoli]